MKKTDSSLEYVCIFGGGAVRGMTYVGAIRALEELGIDPEAVAGSSVGAVLAGLFAVGYNSEELAEVFKHVNFELFSDIHFGFGKDFALSKGGIFLEWIRELIEQKYYGEKYIKGENPPVTFKDLEKNVVIITTDLTNFKYKEFSKFETPDIEIAWAIRISSSMPGLMKPIEYDGALLVDGDLQKSLPLWKASKNLCPRAGRILEFRLEGDFEGKDQNAIDFINTVYSCVTSLSTDFIIETYGNRDKFDYVKINTGSVIIVNFNLTQEKRQEIMDIGYSQTMEYFNSILIDKKHSILKQYRILSKHAHKMKKYISAKRIKAAQIELGNLYMDLCTIKRYIDLKYYDMINDFKDEFMKNLRPAGLFGSVALTNYDSVKSQINSIIIELEERIMELESYVFHL